MVPGLYLAAKVTVWRGIGDELKKLENPPKLEMALPPAAGRDTGPIGWRVSGSNCISARAADTAAASTNTDATKRIFNSPGANGPMVGAAGIEPATFPV